MILPAEAVRAGRQRPLVAMAGSACSPPRAAEPLFHGILVLFLVLLGIWWLVETVKSKSADWKLILSIGLASLAGLVLASRWVYRIFVYSSAATRPVFRVMESDLPKSAWNYLAYLLGPISGYVLIGLGLIGLVWSGLAVKKWHFQVWALLVCFFALPTGLRLMNFRNDYFALVAFIPIAVTAAFGIILLLEKAGCQTGTFNTPDPCACALSAWQEPGETRKRSTMKPSWQPDPIWKRWNDPNPHPRRRAVFCEHHLLGL